MRFIHTPFFTFRRAGLVLAAIVAFASVSSAQQKYWKQLGATLPTEMYCAYFFDANHGVVAGVGAIWLYKNGSWLIPSVPGDNPTYFTSIEELKPGVLYATSGAPYIWYSSDSGASWHNTSTAGSFARDSYLSHDSVYATYAGTFARLDSNICMLSDNNGTVPSISSNGGLTWHQPNGYTTIGGLGVYGDTCRKMFFATSKQDTTYYSLDSGHTWRVCNKQIQYDIMNGANTAVYRQDDSGVWCSVDDGTSWQLLEGPKATSGDRGMFGFGPDGKYIIATTNGAVWLYSRVDSLIPTDPITRGDTVEKCPVTRIPIFVRPFTHPYQMTIRVVAGGPQTLSPSDTTFIIPPFPAPTQTLWYTVNPSISQYPTEVTIFTKADDGCRSFMWEDTFLISPVPIPFTFPNIQFKNCAITRIPLVVAPNAQALRMRLKASADSGWSITPTDTSIQLAAETLDTIWLTPTAPSVPIGSIIHLQATDTVACTVYLWDTSFTVGIKPVPISLSMTDSVGIYACDSVRIPITFDLASCDSLNVDTLIVNPPDSLLTFESTPGLPLARGAMDTIWLKYAPHGRNTRTHYQVTMNSHFVPEGQKYDTTLALFGVSTGSPTPRASAMSSLSINSCTPVTLPLYVTASGCEPIRIDSFQFNQVGIITTGGLTGPDTVAEGATDTTRYTIEALYPGTRPLDIFCYLYRMGDEVTFDTELTVVVNATGASTEPLISAPSKLTLSNCDTSVIPFVLHAPCDSVTIASCMFTINSGLNYSSNLTFPLKLEADSTDSLFLSFPPQGLNQTTSIRAEIKGSYGGTTTPFDTTVQTNVTFACQSGIVTATPVGARLLISGIQSLSGELELDLTKNDATINECQAQIITTLGDVAATRTLTIPGQLNHFNWNLSGLASGAYYLRITAGDYRLSAPFVLLR